MKRNLERQRLVGKIIEKYGDYDRFAIALGIGTNSLSRKLAKKSEFSEGEIERASTLLGIKASEIGLYFFPEYTQKTECLGRRT